MRVTADDAGGWIVKVSPETLRLDAGASGEVVIALQAPAAGDGASTRTMRLRATITDDAGRVGVDEASIALARLDPPAPPVPPPWILTAEGMTSLALVALTLAAVGAMLLASARRRKAEAEAAARQAFLDRETGIKLEITDGPHRFGMGRDLVYRVRVWNETDRPRVATLGVAAAPDGWRAVPSLPRMPLGARESIHVTFLVSPAPSAPAGTRARIVLWAKPEEAEKLDERIEIEVVAPDVRIPGPDERVARAVVIRSDDGVRPAPRR